MSRYFAMVWECTTQEAPREVTVLRRYLAKSGNDWSIFVDCPGLLVAAAKSQGSGGHSEVLWNQAGVLMGTAFRSAVTSSQELRGSQLSNTDTLDRILRTDGRSMISEYWGSYVLFFQDRVRNFVAVLRSPMGTVPCFYAKVGPTVAFFSSIDDIYQSRLVDLTVNWEVIRAQATNRDYLTRRTGIAEIDSLEVGECWQLEGHDIALRTYWSPPEVIRNAAIPRFEDAVSELRWRSLYTVGAWASRHSDIVHSLSGGLDSSIVASCLRSAPAHPNVTCFTQYSTERSGDERRFARSMAQHIGFPLVEVTRDPNARLSRILECARTARPVMHYTACDYYPAIVELAEEVGATAIFDGELGDSLFGRFSSHDAVTEYVELNGVTPHLLTVAKDFAVLGAVSVWTVLRRALRDAAVQRRSQSWSMHNYLKSMRQVDPSSTSFVTADCVEHYEKTLSEHVHPWLQDVRGVPLTRFLMIYGLLMRTSSAYHQPFYKMGDPPILSPLPSQPLVDYCLAIPSHFHISGGLDRSVARNAFANELSTLVLSRSGKSSPEGWILKTIKHNRELLREILLDGRLVQERVLDKRKVDFALSDRVSNSLLSAGELIVYVYIEAWLRLWERTAIRAVA